MPNIFKKKISNKTEYFAICDGCGDMRVLKATTYCNINKGRNSGLCKPCSLKGDVYTEGRQRRAEREKLKYFAICESCHKEREISATAHCNIKKGINSGLCKPCSLKGKKRPDSTGPNHHNWKGGPTSLNIRVRTCTFYGDWRTKVFIRDGYTCQECGDSRGGNLHAHHINPLSEILNNMDDFDFILEHSQLWDIDNGLTLCKDCHKKEHTKDKVPDFYT